MTQDGSILTITTSYASLVSLSVRSKLDGEDLLYTLDMSV